MTMFSKSSFLVEKTTPNFRLSYLETPYKSSLIFSNLHIEKVLLEKKLLRGFAETLFVKKGTTTPISLEAVISGISASDYSKLKWTVDTGGKFGTKTETTGEKPSLTLNSSFTGDITITGKYDINGDGDTSDTGETKTITIKVVELKFKQSSYTENWEENIIIDVNPNEIDMLDKLTYNGVDKNDLVWSIKSKGNGDATIDTDGEIDLNGKDPIYTKRDDGIYTVSVNVKGAPDSLKKEVQVEIIGYIKTDITVKEKDIDFTPGAADKYGHWWIELNDKKKDDGGESYGWWPDPDVDLSLGNTITGVDGVLNGDPDGNTTVDPKHGQTGDTETKYYYKSNKDLSTIKQGIRDYANGYSDATGGEWSWTCGIGDNNCHDFIQDLISGTEFNNLKSKNYIDDIQS